MSWQYKWCLEIKPAPAIIILFGAGGDLARKKLFPAYAQLAAKGLWPEGSKIVCCARREWDDEDLRSYAGNAMGQPENKEILSDMFFVPGDVNDPAFAVRLSEKITWLLQEWQGAVPPACIYHFALAPAQALAAVKTLAVANLLQETAAVPEIRTVFEKPFGFSGQEATEMDNILHSFLREEQIYRTDHYLGKDTIRNILVTRFANRIFEPAWSGENIARILICAPETADVSERSSYYDTSGCIRDMFQNHLLEMLALTAMDAPASPGLDSLLHSKIALLQHVKIKKVSTAQYAGYTDHNGIPRDSHTETAACVSLEIDTPRWRNTDFVLFSGKNMNTGNTCIKVIFRSPQISIFPLVKAEDFAGNILTIDIQPEERMSLAMQVKRPGPNLCMGTAEMSFAFPANDNVPELGAYARLLTEAMLGDRSTFVSGEMIQAGWRIFDPVLAELRQSGRKPQIYQPGAAPEDVFSQLIID